MKIFAYPLKYLPRFDKQKHSAKCSRCEEGYRPMDTDTWSPPCPCPVCGHSSQDEDSRLLQRYKVDIKQWSLHAQWLELNAQLLQNTVTLCML